VAGLARSFPSRGRGRVEVRAKVGRRVWPVSSGVSGKEGVRRDEKGSQAEQKTIIKGRGPGRAAKKKKRKKEVRARLPSL